jgi:hypothetical protein
VLVRLNSIWRTTRQALAATALAVMVTVGAFLASSPASAATMLSEGCAGSVSGNMGDQIALPGKSLSDIVKTAAKTKEVILHLNGVDPDALARAIAAKGTLTVGEIPHAMGGSLGGDVVASVATHALQNEPGLGENTSGTKVATLQAIRDGVTKNCGLTILATDYPPVVSSPSDVPGNSADGGHPGGGSITALHRGYGDITSATPGDVATTPGVKNPSNEPLPGFAASSAGSSRPTDVHNADALASPPSSNDLQLPVLLAVIALAAVTAAMIRVWVLSKTS